ncbi:MAG: carbamoyltransferase HypF [Phycisphaerae bacterium]|nr:carbamoyltransferase HypF [Phycisphaerae bacterium]
MADSSLNIQIRGIVQGVGFRPFVYRLAHQHGLTGWVRNGEQGVEIRVEGHGDATEAFLAELRSCTPSAARIAELTANPVAAEHFTSFEIIHSQGDTRPTVRISPDLPVCKACLRELRDSRDRRHGYPYINCTDCGPRYSIIQGLPYDRPLTTMKGWPLCPACAREYADPLDRRFHAQPVACPECGPEFHLHNGEHVTGGNAAAIAATVELLRSGKICAIKGLGGYHLACDARCADAVRAMRERKYRKEKPFALMVHDLDTAHALVHFDEAGEQLLTDVARPIVLAPARVELPHVAPDNHELGIMLPYTPLHHLLFDGGAPDALVMTSANRSNEPLAYLDDDAFEQMGGIADAFLVGERPIARRVDDSVVRCGPFGPVILRRARGYAPSAVARISTQHTILALGADLKNTITLVVGGQAFVSQHIGDLQHSQALRAFRETIDDLLNMYEVDRERLVVVHDTHPEYASTRHALSLPATKIAVQHHRAHTASVLAEHDAWDEVALGISLDGTGYGDDGAIWGGEVFVGALNAGFERVAHLRPAKLPGGDAAATFPPQAAAGFLGDCADLPDLTEPPFDFPPRYTEARQLADRDIRTFVTTSTGRLFDTAAALLGFTRAMTFEGQAAIWLEQLARTGTADGGYVFPDLDYRPLLEAVIHDRLAGVPTADIARRFHAGVAAGVIDVTLRLCEQHELRTVALSGGVFQNALLLEMIHSRMRRHSHLRVWTNRDVPPNDGGISLGQAALAAHLIQ